MANILIVIAAEGYQDTEYNDTKEVLDKAGHIITTACTTIPAKGSLGGHTDADMLIKDVEPENYEAIIFIGGPGCHDYFNYEPAFNLVHKFYDAGKLTCAICSAPSILANAGILNGITCTCYEDEADNVKSNGALYTGRSVEKDGIIITANGPSASKEFAETINTSLQA